MPPHGIVEHFPSELSLHGENTAVSLITIRDVCTTCSKDRTPSLLCQG